MALVSNQTSEVLRALKGNVEVIRRLKSISPQSVTVNFVEDLYDEYFGTLDSIDVDRVNFAAVANHLRDLVKASMVPVAPVPPFDPAPPFDPTIRCGMEHNGRLVVSVILRECPGNAAHFSTKRFSFFADPDLELFDGDIVVVDADGAPTVGRVVNKDLSAMDLARASKWVIGRVDMSAHEARLAAERQLQALKVKMEAKVKNFEQNHKYLLMAQQDPEMAKMYVEMQKIDKSMPDLPAGTKIAGQIE